MVRAEKMVGNFHLLLATVQVTHYNGTPTTGLGHSPWDVIADALGEFETYWLIPEDDNLDETLMVTAYGQSSGLYAYTLFADHNTKLTLVTANTVCVTPVAGANTIRLIATDSCAAADTCVTVLTVNLNSPPVVSCPASVALDLFALSEVCLPGFTASDPDGNLVNVVVTGGSLSNDNVCFNPVEGLNIITMTATDACGATAVCTTIVYVNLISTCPTVKIEKTHNTLQGHYQDVAITIEDASYDMGGFDFLIAYDASALTFIQATAGEVLTDCAWEYFTYRFGPFGNCGAGCSSGMIRIVALAETNNGPVSPDCFGPADGSPHTLAILRFLVSNDRTLECQYVPIRFFWLDCGDNAIASVTGDTTFLDSKIFEFSGGLLCDETDNVSFPEGDRIANVGAPDYPCMVEEKRVPIRCIEFWNSGIDIICADSIDARGDVNLTVIPNEIGDAVTFINYFIAGLAAFTVSIEGQIAATELNGDGVVLSAADLVYLIRVVIGDAQPLAKLTPFAESVTVRYDGSTVSADAELARHFWFSPATSRSRLAVELMGWISRPVWLTATRMFLFTRSGGGGFSAARFSTLAVLCSILMAPTIMETPTAW